nr:FlgO family outer membrane protein [uncultured Rhodopila sp.]
MRFDYIVLFSTLAMLTGCGDHLQDAPPQLSSGADCPAYAHPNRHYADGAGALPELTYAAVDKMTFCAKDIVSEKVPITVSSITDAQHVDKTSPFGNMLADFARARLAENHMAVSEPRLRSDLLMQADQGEMFLSRDPSKLTMPHPPYAAVLTGTYGVGSENVFVSLKLIRTDNAQVLSAADFVVPRGGDVGSLLGSRL